MVAITVLVLVLVVVVVVVAVAVLVHSAADSGQHPQGRRARRGDGLDSFAASDGESASLSCAAHAPGAFERN